MKRPALIMVALGVVASLHIYTSIKAGAPLPLLHIIREPVDISSPLVRLADVASCHQGDRITVTGWVSDIWEPAGKRAPHTVILRDQSGVLEVVHWLQPPLRISIGDSVECIGTIDLYRGQLQLRLWNISDMNRLASVKDIQQKQSHSESH